jgi:hypothetical protein
MIIVCYLSDFNDFHEEKTHEWIRLDVSEEVGLMLCDNVGKVEDLKLNFPFKYIMCNEL